MTPRGGEHEPSDGVPLDRAAVARSWAAAVSSVAYIPMALGDIEEYLLDLLNQLLDAFSRHESANRTAAEIGAVLVDNHVVGQAALARTVEVLGKALLVERDGGVSEPVGRAVGLIGSLAGGFTEAMRQRTLTQQEDVKRAMMKALQESESRFREVFESSPHGVLITDIQGTVVRANQAIADLLGTPTPDDLRGMSIVDIFYPGAAEAERDGLRDRYRELRARDAERRARGDDGVSRFHTPGQFTRQDGDAIWVQLGVSLLRDSHGEPTHYVTSVEDLTNNKLLTDNMARQATHDALTGVWNRFNFIDRLNTLLARLGPEDQVCLYHLDVETLTVLNNGLGVDVGDEALTQVAKVLGNLAGPLPGGLLGRVDGAEFAFAVPVTDQTPEPERLVALIREELADVRFLNERGVTVGVAIAVVDGLTNRVDAAEAMRRADLTLREAKRAGKGNWDRYDAAHDRRTTSELRLAAALPGAESFGELDLVYRQRRSLTDRSLVAIEVLLDWTHPELGALGPERTIQLAELSGNTPLLRGAALTGVRDQLRHWHGEFGDALPPVVLNLTASQVLDADCGMEIRTAVADLPPGLLRIGLPVSACELDSIPGVMLNLAGAGIEVEMYGLTGAPTELSSVEEHRITHTRLADELVRRVDQSAAGSRVPMAAVAVAGSLVAGGLTTTVGGLDSQASVAFWTAAGIDCGQGDAFGGECDAEGVSTLLRSNAEV